MPDLGDRSVGTGYWPGSSELIEFLPTVFGSSRQVLVCAEMVTADLYCIQFVVLNCVDRLSHSLAVGGEGQR